MTGRRVLWALLIAGLVGFVVLAAAYEHDPLAGLDQDVAEWVAGSLPGWTEWLARPFSWLGGGIGLTPIGVGLVLLLLVTRRIVDAVWTAMTIGGIQVVTALVKEFFDRPRPHEGSAVPLPASDSFPSGHASGAVVTFGVLAALGVERWPERARMFWSAAAVLRPRWQWWHAGVALAQTSWPSSAKRRWNDETQGLSRTRGARPDSARGPGRARK